MRTSISEHFFLQTAKERYGSQYRKGMYQVRVLSKSMICRTHQVVSVGVGELCARLSGRAVGQSSTPL